MGYESATKCSGCQEGKTLKAGKCEDLKIENCLVGRDDLCVACKNQKLVAADGKTCTETACKDTNCEVCTLTGTVETCSKCKSGKALQAGKCETEKTTNCMLQTATECQICQAGYYYSDKSCKASDKQKELKGSVGIISLTSLLTLLFF